MGLVRFASICDHCGTRSQEYEAWPTCMECNDDVCPACEVLGQYDEESNTTFCKRCGVLSGLENGVEIHG